MHSQADNGLASSFTFNPSGIGELAGDLREVRVTTSASATIATPSGWTNITDTSIAGGTRRMYIFQRQSIGEASEPNVTFNLSTSAQYGMVGFHLRNWNTADALDVDPSISSNSANQTSLVANSISPSQTGTLLVCSFHLINPSTSANFSTPSGMTSVEVLEGDGTNGHGVALFSEVLTASGATGTRTSTVGASAPWGASASAFAAIRPGNAMPFFM